MPYPSEQSLAPVEDELSAEPEGPLHPPSSAPIATTHAPLPETDVQPRGGLLGNFVVLAFLAAVVGFGVRSLVVKDNRFGWGMFNHQISYMVEYEWLNEDGTTTPCPTENLQGKTARKLAAGETHVMLYGIGALRLWIGHYLEHLFETGRPTGARAVRAHLSYAVNPVDFSKSEHTTENFQYPPPANTPADRSTRVAE